MSDASALQQGGPGASVRAVEDLFGPIGAQLLEAAASVRVGLARDEGVAPTAQEVLAVCEPLAAAVLADRRVFGSGFVADPSLAVDATYLLAWWQGEARERITESVALRRAADYRSKEWYLAPLRADALHVTGPYVDYVCTDELVVTLTAPVTTADGTTLGVTGADLLAEEVELALDDVLRVGGAVLVDHLDRVVVPGASRRFAGDRVDPSAYDEVVACPGLPLRLLLRGPHDQVPAV